MIIARLTLAMATVIITWFALAPRDAITAALVVTTFAVPAVIVTGFALATGDEAGSASSIISPLVTSATAVIAAAVESHASAAISTHALLHGPVIHATADTAHAHAGRSPAARFAVSAREKCEPGRDNGHSRAHN